jgi:hypothetical protein
VNGRQTLSETSLTSPVLRLRTMHGSERRPRTVSPAISGSSSTRAASEIEVPRSADAGHRDHRWPRAAIDRPETVRNLDEWYAEFPVRPGSALYLQPADRVTIW